jgi:hypothetical protein
MRRQFTLGFRVAVYSRSEQRFELLSPPTLNETFSIFGDEDISPGSRMCLKDEGISQLVTFPFRQLTPVLRTPPGR